MTSLENTVNKVIAQVPSWANAQDLEIERLAGLTNTNYRVTVDGEPFVLRVSGPNTPLLGIDRAAELAALTVASTAGIGPEVLHFIQPSGHLVTRFIEGCHWTADEYRNSNNLRRIVETAKRLHALPGVKVTFSPFRRTELFARNARALGAPLPPGYDAMMERVRRIESSQRQDPFPTLGFCHNDLFFVNILDDGAVRLVDWEFAGMGDIFFDLATLVYAHESDGPLPPELEDYILKCYFGEVNAEHRKRMAQMKFMVQFFAAMWSLVQHGIEIRDGTFHEEFSYLSYGNYIFEQLLDCPAG